MSGKTKRKYISELVRFNKSLKRPLCLIQEVLPYDYNKFRVKAGKMVAKNLSKVR